MTSNMFEVGKHYETKAYGFTVLDLNGNNMAIKKDDGTIKHDANMSVLENMVKNHSRIANTVSRPPTKTNSSSKRTSQPKEIRILQKIDWTQYDKWNEALFQRYFGPDNTDRLAYIDVDGDELKEITPGGNSLSAETDFVETIRETLVFQKGKLLNQYFLRLSDWDSSGAETPPPFIAVLALFCLVAQKMQAEENLGANNYYDRLAALLFKGKYSKEEQHQFREGIRLGFERAEELWIRLEAWLDNNDGNFGKKTSDQMSGLRHVGRPISQILLRSTDRKKLPGFFLEMGLSPQKELPPSDMERMMAPWVASPPLSKGAFSKWNQSQKVRLRMSEIASLELATWDGSISSDTNTGTINMPIAIVAQDHTGPFPQLRWYVTFRIPPGVTSATFNVEGDAKDRLIMQDGSSPNSISVQLGTIGDQWSDPISDISIPDFLEFPVNMLESKGKYKVSWIPHRVLVLTWDDEFKIYRYEKHLKFSRKAIVLAHQTVADKVSDTLTPVNSGPIDRLSNAPDIPEGWVLFKNIRLSMSPNVGKDLDLQSLVPNIWSDIDWNGGIALPGRREWLLSRLPKLEISSVDQFDELRVKINKRSAPYDIESQLDIKEDGNSLDIDLSKIPLEDGHYSLTVTAYRDNESEEGENLGRKNFEICSPATTKSAGQKLSYQCNKPTGMFSASPIDDSTHECFVNGTVTGPKKELIILVPEIPRTLDNSSKAEEEDFLGTATELKKVSEDVNKCFIGPHTWLLEKNKKVASGTCTFCGNEKTFRPVVKGYFRNSKQNSTIQKPPAIEIEDSSTTNSNKQNGLETDKPTDYDGLLEACFTLNGGSWNHFELLARQVSEESSFPQETLQLFSSLGHLDVELDPVDSRPIGWKIAPTPIVTTEPGDAFLAGFLSQSLLGDIEKEVQDLGGIFTNRTVVGGPSSYFITDMDIEAIKPFINKQDQVKLCERPDRTIASYLMPLSKILETAPVVGDPGMVQAFSEENKWKEKSYPSHDGLYRTDSTPRSYLLLENGTWHRVSYRVGKHLAARQRNHSLLAYNPESRDAACPLGAQLPGLYERALVLSSGIPPEIDIRKKIVTYRRVPTEIASAVWSTIYN